MVYDDERLEVERKLKCKHGGGANGQRIGLIAWCLYDWASSAFSTIVATFVFPVYFTQMVARDPIEGATQWSYAVAGSSFAVALGAPALGAVADKTGRRKPWLLAFTLLTVVFHCGALAGGALAAVRLSGNGPVCCRRHDIWLFDDFLQRNASRHRAPRLCGTHLWLGLGAWLCGRPHVPRRGVVRVAEDGAAAIRPGGRAS